MVVRTFAGIAMHTIAAVLSTLHITSAFSSIGSIRYGSLQTARQSYMCFTFRTQTILHAIAHSEADNMLVNLFRDIKDSDLRVIFDKLDADRSGSITDSDWQNALKTIGVTSPTKEYTSLLSYLDANQDGSVDFADFQLSVNRLRQRFPRTNEGESASFEQWLDLNEKRTVRTPSDGQIDTALTSIIRKMVRIFAASVAAIPSTGVLTPSAWQIVLSEFRQQPPLASSVSLPTSGPRILLLLEQRSGMTPQYSKEPDAERNRGGRTQARTLP
jgi:Ca2+-binding EF-hand superfamily protein